MSDDAPSTQIALPEGMVIPTTSVDNAAIKLLSKLGDYLPYVMITNATSKAVQDEKALQGMITIVENGIPIELGKEAVFVVFGERSKAMDLSDGVLSYFDILSPQFKTVFEKSKVQGNMKQLAGLEYLVWTPDVGDNGTFATLFCANASLKKEVPMIRSFLGGKAMIAKVEKAKNNKGQWWKAVFSRYSAPIATTPDQEEFKKVLNDFNNPKSSVVETAPAQAGAERAR